MPCLANMYSPRSLQSAVTESVCDNVIRKSTTPAAHTSEMLRALNRSSGSPTPALSCSLLLCHAASCTTSVSPVMSRATCQAATETVPRLLLWLVLTHCGLWRYYNLLRMPKRRVRRPLTCANMSGPRRARTDDLRIKRTADTRSECWRYADSCAVR
jgi:hypothetical protein